MSDGHILHGAGGGEGTGASAGPQHKPSAKARSESQDGGDGGDSSRAPGMGLRERPAQWSAQRGDASLRNWAGLATEQRLKTMKFGESVSP